MTILKPWEIEELATELIRIQSLSSEKKNLHEVIQFVKDFFGNLNWIFVNEFEYEWFPSISIQNFEWKKADIVLNWHLDVVPASEDWQFEVKVIDQKLFGRWSADMKAWVAAMMLVFKKIVEENYTNKKVSLILTTDEEVSWEFGSLALAKQWYLWDVVIIPDWWSERNLVTIQKWILRITLTAEGKSAHASKPWLWNNPNDIIIHTYQELKAQIHDEFQMSGENEWWTTLTLICLQSGEQVNKIPDTAVAKIDIRFTEKYRLETIKKIINQICEKNKCKVEYNYWWEIMFSDEKSQLILDYKKITEKLLWDNVEFGKEHSWSDWRFFSMFGCDVILHRPNCANLHAKDEWVEIDWLYRFAEIVYNYIKR